MKKFFIITNLILYNLMFFSVDGMRYSGSTRLLALSIFLRSNATNRNHVLKYLTVRNFSTNQNRYNYFKSKYARILPILAGVGTFGYLYYKNNNVLLTNPCPVDREPGRITNTDVSKLIISSNYLTLESKDYSLNDFRYMLNDELARELFVSIAKNNLIDIEYCYLRALGEASSFIAWDLMKLIANHLKNDELSEDRIHIFFDFLLQHLDIASEAYWIRPLLDKAELKHKYSLKICHRIFYRHNYHHMFLSAMCGVGDFYENKIRMVQMSARQFSNLLLLAVKNIDFFLPRANFQIFLMKQEEISNFLKTLNNMGTEQNLKNLCKANNCIEDYKKIKKIIEKLKCSAALRLFELTPKSTFVKIKWSQGITKNLG